MLCFSLVQSQLRVNHCMQFFVGRCSLHMLLFWWRDWTIIATQQTQKGIPPTLQPVSMMVNTHLSLWKVEKVLFWQYRQKNHNDKFPPVKEDFVRLRFIFYKAANGILEESVKKQWKTA